MYLAHPMKSSSTTSNKSPDKIQGPKGRRRHSEVVGGGIRSRSPGAVQSHVISNSASYFTEHHQFNVFVGKGMTSIY